jgi:hypothetical protein
MICLAKSNSENDFFITNQYYDNNYFCVTNTTYALSWIATKVDETLKQGIVQRLTGPTIIILLYQGPATVYRDSTIVALSL